MDKQLIHNTTQSSMEISKNSKGATYSIKAYGSTIEEVEAVADSLLKLAKEKVDKIALELELNK